MKALLTYREAAELLSVTHWTVRAMVREGRLNATGEGKGRRVTMGSILRIGELDGAAIDLDGHNSPGMQTEESVRRHTKGDAHCAGPKRTASQASKELDELLGKRRT